MIGHRRRDRGRRVVAIGGGTRLPGVLAPPKRYPGNPGSGPPAPLPLTHDRGSPRRLPAELNMLPPGDIRNCLVALAEVEPLMAQLFQFRFGGDGSLSGHSFGNLFLAALTNVTGNFLQAIRISGKVLAVQGTILPSTLESVTLGAELTDGSIVHGETKLRQGKQPVRRVFIEPAAVRALPEVLAAIARADAIVLAPGSLYTSLIPNLLVGAGADARRKAAALRVYVGNLMTEPGETDSLSLADHLDALYAHSGRGVVDGVVVHGPSFPRDVLARYERVGARPVDVDRERLRGLGLWV